MAKRMKTTLTSSRPWMFICEYYYFC